jgi:hypothetical protein
MEEGVREFQDSRTPFASVVELTHAHRARHLRRGSAVKLNPLQYQVRAWIESPHKSIAFYNGRGYSLAHE